MTDEKYQFVSPFGIDFNPGQYTGLNLQLMRVGANVRIGPNLNGDRIIAMGSGLYLKASDRESLKERLDFTPDSDLEVNEAVILTCRESL